jgi:hypothetical protein
MERRQGGSRQGQGVAAAAADAVEHDGGRLRQLHGLLNTLLRSLPLQKPSTLGSKAFDQMLARADGITSNIFTLLTELVVAAIRSGREQITAADIRQSDVLASPLGAAV